MFQNSDGKTYDCPYCHNEGEKSCSRGAEVGADNTRTVILEGATITVDWGQVIRSGDIYLALCSTGHKLLTCKYVAIEHYVMPVEKAYAYDTWECAKVINIA
jgi:hypothetical protein